MSGEEFREPFARLLGETFPPARLREIAVGEDWNAERDAIEASGFLDALDGGLSLAECAPLLVEIGHHAAPVELGEAMLARGGVEREHSAALSRAAAIAGAAARLLAMTVGYARERSQFGKPIGSQQAIQQSLAVMAEDVAAVRMAVGLACGRGLPLDDARVGLAKAIASEAAPRIADSAHAVFGAIGISAEHDLHLYTTALRRWRIEAGSEAAWQERLGCALLDDGDDALDWTLKTLF